MKISEERKRNLYAAIAGNITDLRIITARGDKANVPIDKQLFDLEKDIWNEVVKVLGIEG